VGNGGGDWQTPMSLSWSPDQRCLNFEVRLIGTVQTRPILYGSIFQVKKVAGSLDKFSVYRY
jgi:hypothetical protein